MRLGYHRNRGKHNTTQLPHIDAVYNEIQKEEKKNRIREQRSKGTAAEIELAQEADRIFKKQTLLHRMTKYESSDSGDDGGDDRNSDYSDYDDDDGSSNEDRDSFIGHDHDNGDDLLQHSSTSGLKRTYSTKSNNSEYDEERMKIHLIPSDDTMKRMREERLEEMLAQYKQERRKAKRREMEKKQQMRSATTLDNYHHNNLHSSELVDGSKKRSRTEMSLRSDGSNSNSSIAMEYNHDRIPVARPMKTVMDNDLIRPFRKHSVTADSTLITKYGDRSMGASPSQQSMTTPKPPDRILSQTPLPPTSLYVDEHAIHQSSNPSQKKKLVLMSKKRANTRLSNLSDDSKSIRYGSVVDTSALSGDGDIFPEYRTRLANQVSLANLSRISHFADNVASPGNGSAHHYYTTSSKTPVTKPEPLIGVTHSKTFDGQSQSYISISRDQVMENLRQQMKKKDDVLARLYPKPPPKQMMSEAKHIKLYDVWEYWEDYKYKYRPEYHRKVTQKYGPGGKTKEQADKLPKISLIPIKEGGFRSVITENSSDEEQEEEET